MRLNRKQRQELERELLNEDQLRDLETFDKAVRRSNQRFYNNCCLETDINMSIDIMTPTVRVFQGAGHPGGRKR